MKPLTPSGAQRPSSAAEEIYALARRHGVTYRPTASDVLADDFARLLGDFAALDEPALLLIALQQAGHLSNSEVARLHAAYLQAKDQ